MKHCSICGRYNIPELSSCKYCNSKKLDTFSSDILMKSDKDYSKYKIKNQKNITVYINNEQYSIVRFIGKGGFSTVLEVKSLSTNKNYALKIPVCFDDEFSNIFGASEVLIKDSKKYIRNEIDTLNRIITKGYDSLLIVYHAGPILFRNKVKEFSTIGILSELAFTTLAHIIHNEAAGINELVPEDKVVIVKDILESLSTIHTHSLAHRDLSPDNIFAVRRNDQVRFVIADFGTAKQWKEFHTSNLSDICDHKPYSDPLRYEDPIKYRDDKRCDIYSFGVIFHDIIKGNFWKDIVKPHLVPVKAPADFTNILTKEFKKSDYNSDQYEIILKAVKIPINKRYQNVSRLSKDIKKSFIRAKKQYLSTKTIKSKELFINYSIALPLDKLSNDNRIIDFSGVSNINFSSFSNYTIKFLKTRITNIEIINSKLYSGSHDESNLYLNINRDRFFKYKSKFPSIFEYNVKMQFSFIINVYYYNFKD